MFTRCTQCQTLHTLTLEQLRAGRGMLQCRHCAAQFDALTHLAETETLAGENTVAAPDLPWDQNKRSEKVYWHVGASLCALLFVAQIVYFEGYGFTQKPAIRPVLAAWCEWLACRLPVYKNPDELNLIGSFTPTPEHYYELRAALSNKAAFPQAYPNLKLILLNYNGDPFAVRIFQPQEYLPEPLQATELKPDATTEISLKIAAPQAAIGGSSFELLY